MAFVCRRPGRRAAGAVLPLLLVAPLAAYGQGNSPRLELTLEPSTVRAQGATAGGKVIFFGVDRLIDEDDYATVVVTRAIEADEDNDGIVELTVERAISPRHVWIAVDLTTGSEATSVPEQTGQRREGWRGRGLRRGAAEPDAIDEPRGVMEALVVRAGVGAWGGRVADGDTADEDREANGRLVAVLADLEPLDDSPASPLSFEKDDWVFVVDPIAMSLTSDRVRTTP